jgi:hypothetical protein
MSIVQFAKYEDLQDEARHEYDVQVKENGRVTNMKRTLLHSVAAFKAYQQWYPLRDEIQSFIGERGVFVFSLAISTQNECVLCSSFFRKIFIERGEDPESLVLNEKEQLLAEYGSEIAKDPNQIPEELYAKLASLFDEKQIVLLTAFAGIMAATNIFNSALKVDLDDYLENFKKL